MSKIVTFHLGLPFTAVGSLQQTLNGSQKALEKIDAIYPRQFRGGVPAHHQLARTLKKQDNGSRAMLDRFRQFRLETRLNHIIISSENLVGNANSDLFSELITDCKRSHRTRVVISLRRMDRLAEAWYWHAAVRGRTMGSLESMLQLRRKWISGLFQWLGRIGREEIFDEIRMVKYDEEPGTNRQVMVELGAASILKGDEDWHPDEPELSTKAKIALQNIDWVSARCGEPLSQRELIEGFRSGLFRSKIEQNDFSVMTAAQRRKLHSTALAAAQESHFHQYCAFFPEDTATENRTTLSRDILDAKDFDAIRQFLGSLRRTSKTTAITDAPEAIRPKAVSTLPANRTTVFQFWDHSPPVEIVALMNSWKAVEPEFQYEFYDNERAMEFIRSNYGDEVCQAYETCNVPAMKSDLFRYCFLLARGGIYADADLLYVGSLANCYRSSKRGVLIERPSISLGTTICNGFIAIKHAGDPLMEYVLRAAVTNIRNRSSNDVWSVTGPGILSSLYYSANPTDRQCFQGYRVVRLSDLKPRVFRMQKELPYKKSALHWTVIQKRQSIFCSRGSMTIV